MLYFNKNKEASRVHSPNRARQGRFSKSGLAHPYGAIIKSCKKSKSLGGRHEDEWMVLR